MISLLDLPEEALELVSHSLPAPDVLSLLSTHPVLHRIGLTPGFWRSLEHAQYYNNNNNTGRSANNKRPETKTCKKEAKDNYLLKAHCHRLPAARWYHLIDHGSGSPSAREGHLSCRLGNYVVITGGFTEDNRIYVKQIQPDDDDDDDGNWWTVSPQRRRGSVVDVDEEEANSRHRRHALPPQQPSVPTWAYGASLTALDDHRAVRFGGFQAGGYSGEIHQVAVLHLKEQQPDDGTLTAYWEFPECKPPESPITPGWHYSVARAYHSATLLFQRYLFVVGGMQSRGCILNPMILDTQTWTWYQEGITSSSSSNNNNNDNDTNNNNPEDTRPTPRHGHSLIDDSERRDRLVLFGGGSGSDLLRSGRDNTEVWALNLKGAASTQDPLSTLPWEWQRLLPDQPNPDDNDNEPDEGMQQEEPADPNQLSPAEKLCLGRCHAGHRVGRDTVLLVFGSGRPTTNGILGFHLDRNEFFRPAVQGPLPKARFTFGSVYVEELGYLLVHGGYSVQASGTIMNSCILDLAPGMKRAFQWRPVNRQARSNQAVTDQQALAQGPGMNGPEAILEHMGILMNTPRHERAGVAERILGHSRRLGGRLAMFLHLVASGQVELTEDGAIRQTAGMDDDNDDDDDDSEFELSS